MFLKRATTTFWIKGVERMACLVRVVFVWDLSVPMVNPTYSLYPSYYNYFNNWLNALHDGGSYFNGEVYHVQASGSNGEKYLRSCTASAGGTDWSLHEPFEWHVNAMATGGGFAPDGSPFYANLQTTLPPQTQPGNRSNVRLVERRIRSTSTPPSPTQSAAPHRLPSSYLRRLGGRSRSARLVCNRRFALSGLRNPFVHARGLQSHDPHGDPDVGRLLVSVQPEPARVRGIAPYCGDCPSGIDTSHLFDQSQFFCENPSLGNLIDDGVVVSIDFNLERFPTVAESTLNYFCPRPPSPPPDPPPSPPPPPNLFETTLECSGCTCSLPALGVGMSGPPASSTSRLRCTARPW